jgi:energy-coupling factor transporter ATP-binding protein EcfA2
MSVYISSIAISDTFGTKSVKFSPGTVTRIKGHNGSGKSSILRALAYLFEGGCSPDAIRKGALQSTVELKLSNGVVITKTTAPIKPRKAKKDDPDQPTKYSSRLEVLDADETPMPAPQTYINDLSKALAIDPSILLRIDTTTAPGKKQLADTLMRLVPISFSPEEIGRAVAYRSTLDSTEADAVALRQSPESDITLDDLKKLCAEVTENRRRVGQTRDDSDGAVNRLQKALPEGNHDGARLNVALEEAEEYRRSVESAIADRKIDIEKEKNGALAQAKDIWQQAVQANNTKIDEQIRALEAERARLNDVARAERDRQEGAIEDLTVKEYQNLEAESKPEVENAIAAVAKLKEQVANFHRAATLREEIETQLAACRAAHWKYDRLTEVLQTLEALRLEKLSGLPVRGLVVEDGMAFIDGVEWQNVNLARRVEAVLEICTQQTGKLPFVLLDDSEHLDAETRAAVEHGLAEAGYQLISAQVSDDPLTIETAEVMAHA